MAGVDARVTVHLLRHGEVHNPDHVLYGRLPHFRLSPAGEDMARTTADWFAGRDVTHLVASPLERAQQTAQPIADTLGLPIATDDRLIEAGNDFEGQRVTGRDGVLKHPANWWKYRNFFRPSWGEPYLQIAQRMQAAVLSARDRASGHEAVCVSHQLPIVCLRRYNEHKHLWHDPRHRQCSLASITSFVFDGDELAGIEYTEPAGRTSNRIGQPPPGA